MVYQVSCPQAALNVLHVLYAKKTGQALWDHLIGAQRSSLSLCAASSDLSTLPQCLGKYSLTILDVHTTYSEVKVFKAKSYSANVLIQKLTRWEKQTGKKVKTLWSAEMLPPALRHLFAPYSTFSRRHALPSYTSSPSGALNPTSSSIGELR